MLTRPIPLLLALCAATGLIFGLWPELDLWLSGAIRGSGGFHFDSGPLKALRAVLYYLPATAMGLVTLGWLAARFGLPLPKALHPSGRSVLFLALGLALGPGLLVNVGLKDHWHRPRPVQVSEFGGSAEFRPWYRLDGACQKNCSFVSGEVAASAWLVAPASLVPAPWRVPAVTAALVVTAATAVLRVAFGGHFSSDVIFAALFTLLLVVGLHARLLRAEGQGLRPRDPHL